MKHFDTERMCRINGAKPTQRDRWTAFYRLYRLSHGHGGFQDIAAAECFRVLFKDWRFIRLVEESVATLNMTHIPKFMRKTMLEHRRRERQGFPELASLQSTARRLSERGVEVTPDEVAEVRLKLIKHFRFAALRDGVPVPQDDDELLRWLRRVGL